MKQYGNVSWVTGFIRRNPAWIVVSVLGILAVSVVIGAVSNMNQGTVTIQEVVPTATAQDTQWVMDMGDGQQTARADEVGALCSLPPGFRTAKYLSQRLADGHVINFLEINKDVTADRILALNVPYSCQPGRKLLTLDDWARHRAVYLGKQ